MKWLVGLLAISVVVNGALLGTKKCTTGPSYWCASLENAKECGATDHCLKKVWPTMNVSPNTNPLTETSPCTFCKDIVGDVRKLVLNEAVLDEIHEYLSKACGFMPDKFSNEKCNEISEHYLEEFVGMVNQSLNADLICQLVKLCPSSSDGKSMKQHALAVPTAEVKETPACTLCKDLVTDVKKYLEDDATWTQIRLRIKETCSLMPDDYSKQQCNEIATHYLNEFITAVNQTVDPSALCKQFNLCQNASRQSLKVTGPVTPTCTLCKDMVAAVKKFVENNATWSEIRLHMKEFCSLMPDDYSKSQCNEIHEHYLDQFIAAVKTLDPVTVCQQFKLCQTSVTHTRLEQLKVTPSTACALCKGMVRDVKKYLTNNASWAEIRQYMEEICNFMPDDYSKQTCHNVAEHYLEEFIAMANTTLNPELVCEKFKLCQPSSQLKSAPMDSLPCTYCKDMVADVKKYLLNENFWEQVSKYMQEACTLMPDDYSKAKCVNIYEHYLREFITMVNQTDSATVCQHFHLCPSSVKTLVAQQLLKAEVKETQACTLCKDLVTDVKKYLEDDATWDQVRLRIKETCSLMPDDYSKQQCNEIATHYLDEFITAVNQTADPSAICKQFNLCQNTSAQPMKSSAPVTPTCTLCKDMVGAVKKFLQNNATLSEIRLHMKEFCSLMPDDYFKSQCDEIYEYYLDQFITAVKTLNPDTVCQKFKLCQSSVTQTRLEQLKVTTSCTLCKSIVADVKKFIANNDSWAEIRQYMNEACNFMPDDYSKQICHNVAEHYLEEFIATVSTALNPELVCEKFKLCQPSSQLKSVPMDSLPCTYCKDMVADVQKYLLNENFLDEVTKYMQEACNLMPDDYSKEKCTSIYQHYMREFIAMVNQTDPATVCQHFHLCPSSVKTLVAQQLLKAEVKETPACTLCKDLVTDVKKYLEDDATWTQIRLRIKETCSLMPDDYAKQQCNEIATHYLDEFITAVNQTVDPSAICKQFNLCQNTSTQPMKSVPKDAPPCTFCTYCEHMVTDVKKYLVNENFLVLLIISTAYSKLNRLSVIGGVYSIHLLTSVKLEFQDEVTKYMQEACNLMPDDYSKGKCASIYKHYLGEFITMVNQTDATTVCQHFHLCPSSLRTVVAQQPLKPSLMRRSPGYVGGDDVCAGCKTAIADAKAALENKDNQAELKQVMEDLCVKFGGKYTTKCKLFVETMFDKMIAAVDSQLTDDLCTKLGLCSSSNVKLDPISIIRVVFTKMVKKNALQEHVSQVGADDACTMCEEAVNYVKLFVNNNETEQEVQDLLENEVCAQLGGLADMCKEAVEQYFPELWAELIQLLDPKTLCTDLGLCTAGHKVPLPKVKASMQCILCEFVVEKLAEGLVSDATESKVTATVEKVCTIFPTCIRDDCDWFIEKYGPDLIELLVKRVVPSKICGSLGLCPSEDGAYH